MIITSEELVNKY